METLLLNRLTSYVNTMLFAVVSIIGLAVMVGWAIGYTPLVTVLPELAPMQFNNALCFLLLGLAGVSYTLEKPKLLLVFGVLGLILSTLTVIQYPLGIDLGIDLLFINTDKIIPTAHPGRMAPNSAFGHITAFLSVLLVTRNNVWFIRWAGWLGAMVAAAGMVSLAGYAIDLDGGFDWGPNTQMALHTSICFVISGLALGVTIIPKQMRIEEVEFNIWPYIIILLVVFFFVEFQIPQNVATGIMYALVIAIGWYARSRKSFFIIGILCTIIVMLDVVLTAESVSAARFVVARVTTLVAIWVAVLLLYFLKRGNDKVAENEAKLSSIFESSGEGILVVDSQMNIQMANGRLEAMFGYKADELHGQKLSKLIPMRFHDVHEHHTASFLKEPFNSRQMGINTDLYAVKKDGSEFPVEVGLSSFRHDGQVYVTANVSDITEVKNSRTRLKLAVSGTTAGIWDWVSIERDEQWWSPQFFKLLGYEDNELTPELNTFKALLHPDDHKITFRMVERHLQQKMPFKLEYRLKMKTGQYRWFLGTGQATWDKDGKPLRMVGTIIDVHQRKMAERAAAQHLAQLAQKNKEMEEFTYVASHDLQEPVRTIGSFANLFVDMYADKLDEMGKQSLTYMKEASERSQQLIIDLLDYGRLGRNAERVEVDLNETLRDVLADMAVKIEEVQADVVSDDLPKIIGLPTELRLLFQNLISNGIKFCKPEVKPVVSITVQHKGGFYEIAVTDNGIGIEEKHQKQIFTIFRRLHGRGEYEGTGIGLAHCKKVVELHGGTIWVKSEPGIGTTFRFTLADRKEE